MPATIKRSVWTLVTLCAVLGLDGMDVASMSPTLPAIRDELGMSAASLQWVVSAYVIGYGGFVLLGGRLADLFPPRRLLLVAMLIFAAASFVGALADDGDVLIVTRLAKGIAAGFTAPAALAILLRIYTEEDERNRALGAFISTGAVGFTSGLALGGALTGASWRWTMVLPTCLALAIAAAAVRFVPALSRATTDRRRVDLIGALLVTTGLLSLVYGVSNASSAGWANRETLLALAGSGLLLTAFVAVEHVRREPLVPLGIFGRPELAPANVAALLFQGSYVAFQFVATLYLQERLDWTPLQTGLAFVPGGLAVVLLSSRFAGLVSRVGAWPLAAGGLVLEAVGYPVVRAGHRRRRPRRAHAGGADRHRPRLRSDLPVPEHRCRRPCPRRRARPGRRHVHRLDPGRQRHRARRLRHGLRRERRCSPGRPPRRGVGHRRRHRLGRAAGARNGGQARRQSSTRTSRPDPAARD
jgi:MFS family permease